jgi:RND family efflux transporter MFP subunit
MTTNMNTVTTMHKMLVPFTQLAALAALAALTAPTHAAEFNCLLEPRKVVELRSPTNGLVERVDAERGQFVRAGQVVVALDIGLEKAALNIAHQRATMDGAIRTGESRVAFSTQKYKRREELLSAKYVSQQDRDESATELKLASAELQDAKDNRRLAELEVKRNEEQIRLRAIRSPVSGVVIERNVHPGELADPGEQRKPLLRVADVAVLHAEVVLPAEAYAYVKQGQRAIVRAEVPSKVEAQGTVKVVDRVLDAASGTFGVRLEVPNAGLKIPAGIACRVELPEVPAQALQRAAYAPRTGAPVRPQRTRM